MAVRIADRLYAVPDEAESEYVPARVVMDILGHSQIALTMNTYTHVLPELKREAAKR